MKYVLDTNIILYLLSGRLAETLSRGEYLVSIITEIELLSYPSIDKREEEKIRTFLTDINIISLSPKIRDATVRLRRENSLKLPDAIIVATALTLDAELLTNDKRLHNIPNLSSRAIELKK